MYIELQFIRFIMYTEVCFFVCVQKCDIVCKLYLFMLSIKCIAVQSKPPTGAYPSVNKSYLQSQKQTNKNS